MGTSVWSSDEYYTKQDTRARSGVSTFSYDSDIRYGRAKQGTHEALNPYKVTREARDSEKHPQSLPIVVGLDVTGSMDRIPRQIQSELPNLMEAMLQYVPDPQILFAAVGDALSDYAPLQVGQFESGAQMDDDLNRFYLEGRGGGQEKESYGNLVYFRSRHTSTDAWEKRKKKGYLFLIGDEMTHPSITKGELSSLFGDPAEKSLPIKKVFAEAAEKWHIFFIIPQGTSHGGERWLREYWEDMLGKENVLALESPKHLCALIAATVGLVEGKLQHTELPREKKTAPVAKTLESLATSLVRVAKADLPKAAKASSKVERL